MTQGKSKRVPKGGKKKKKIDHMSKKVWFDVKSPAPFSVRQVCKTFVNKTAGTRIAEHMLKGRVFEVSVGDLMNDEEYGHQLVRLKIEDVKGTAAYTSFHGMRFTKDKLLSLPRKWHTVLSAETEVSTTDGYKLRMFAIGVTRRRELQTRKTTYCYSSQKDTMEARMREEMKKHASKSTIIELTRALINNTIGNDIARACARTFPLQNVFVHKVKVLKAPKVDISKIESDIAEAVPEKIVGKEVTTEA